MRLTLNAPHQIYRNLAGQRRPGVTTVLGSLAKPQLYGWYAGTEREGILEFMDRARTMMLSPAWTAEQLRTALPQKDGKPQWFAEIRRDKAADLGTIVHARIEAWLRGEELEPDDLPPDLYAESIHGYDRFRRWWDEKRFMCVGSEVQMVSEEMQVGGTMDVAARGLDQLGLGISVVDIKSSKASQYWPYKENKAQAQTYGRMWTELNHAPVHEVWLYRCGTTPQDKGQEYQLSEKERSAGNRLFDGALLAYEAAKELE
jgi:hypothetical protein